MQPKTTFTQEEIESLTDRIQNAGTEVVNAKAGAVSICSTYWVLGLHTAHKLFFQYSFFFSKQML